MTTHPITLPPSPRPIGRIGLRTATPSTIISRFGPVWLLFVSKHEKVTWWTEICDEFCRPRENVFFRRVKEVWASLGQVYRAKRRLCWEINRHFYKIFDFLLEAKYLSDHPRILIIWNFVMYILALMKRWFKIRLNDKRLFCTHSVLI